MLLKPATADRTLERQSAPGRLLAGTAGFVAGASLSAALITATAAPDATTRGSDTSGGHTTNEIAETHMFKDRLLEVRPAAGADGVPSIQADPTVPTATPGEPAVSEIWERTSTTTAIENRPFGMR